MRKPSENIVIAALMRGLGVLLFMLVQIHDIHAQCEVNGINGFPWVISEFDPSSFEIEIEVSDSVHTDLLGPQGICGVSLSFTHGQVSDLTIELVAPNDSVVTLVGPSVPNGAPFSIFGVTHNIHFVPNSAAADPDPFFTDQWSNENSNWGTNPTMDGTYYPYFGDLETSFGDSPVSGKWTIRVSDEFITGGGVVESVELIFCESSISCFFCEAQVEGYSSPYDYCEGADLDFMDIEASSLSESQSYTTIYVLDNGSGFQIIDANFPFEDLTIGTYDIYAVNVSNMDSPELIQIISMDGLSPIDLPDTLCFAVSDPPLQFNVMEPMNTAREVSYCPDEIPFEFEGRTISNPDTTFDLVLDDCGNSESISFIPSMSQAVISADTFIIGCNNIDVTINAEESVVGDGAQINWIRNGFLLSGVNSLSVDVINDGEYVLQINDNGCLSRDTTRVVFEIVGKEYEFVTNDITCDSPLANIAFAERGSTIRANWTGPGIRSDSTLVEAITVELPGIYQVDGLDTAGCVFTEEVEVFADTIFPMIQVTSGELSCMMPEVIVELNSPDNIRSIDWIQSGITISQGNTFTTSSSDTLFISVIGENGCMTSAYYLIPVDTNSVVLTGEGDYMVTCNDPMATIGVPDQANATFEWTLDGAVISAQSSINTNESGTYQLVGTAINGCTDTAIYNVIVDTLIPDFTFAQSTASLNCLEDSAVLSIDIQNGLDITWLSPDIEDPSLSTQVVYDSGSYIVDILNPSSGCNTNHTFEVESDMTLPSFSIQSSDITCLDSIGRLNVITDADNEVEITINDMPVQNITAVQVLEESSVTVLVTGLNGCSVDSFLFISDMTEVPQFPDGTPSALILDCIENTVSFRPDIDSSVLSGYYFIDDLGNVINEDSVVFDAPGSFEFVVETAEGCTNTQVIEVLPNIFVDTFDLGIPEGVICDQPFITVDLSFAEQVPDLTFQWSISGPSPSIFENGPMITLSGEGRFIIDLIDNRNGCAVSDTFDLNIPAEMLNPFSYSVIDESCPGSQDGMLFLDPVSGGQGDITLTWDGAPISSVDLNNLSSGDYLLMAEDELGCMIDTVIQIESGSELSFELGEDISLFPREIVSLDPTILLGNSQLFSAEWTYNGEVISDMTSVEFTPSENGILVLTAINTDACTFSDSVRVMRILSLDDLVFIPNVLSPSSLSGNDLLIGNFAESLMAVNSFSLFDRWGNRILRLDDLNPGESKILWDGTINGSPAQSGVYVYHLEVQLSNGVIEYGGGDITLLK